jgi:hypothetical protein
LTNFSDKKQLTGFSINKINFSKLKLEDSNAMLQGVSREMWSPKFDKAKPTNFLKNPHRRKTTPKMQSRANTKSFDSKAIAVEECEELGESSRNLKQPEEIGSDLKLTRELELARKRGDDRTMRKVNDPQLQDAGYSYIDDYLIYIHQSFYGIVTNEFLIKMKNYHRLAEWSYIMKIGEGTVWRLRGNILSKLGAMDELFSSIKKVKKPTGEDCEEEDRESEYFINQVDNAPFYPEEISFIFLVPSWFEKLAIEAIKSNESNSKQLDIRIMYPMKDIHFIFFAIRENVEKSANAINDIYKYCAQNHTSVSENLSLPESIGVAEVEMTAKLIFTKEVLDLESILNDQDFIMKEFNVNLHVVNVKPERFIQSDVDYAVILLGESMGVLRAIQYIFDWILDEDSISGSILVPKIFLSPLNIKGKNALIFRGEMVRLLGGVFGSWITGHFRAWVLEGHPPIRKKGKSENRNNDGTWIFDSGQ